MALEVSFTVSTITCTKDINLSGKAVGDLRAAVHDAFDILPFEQNLTFKSPDGEFVQVKADDSVLFSEIGLKGGEELYVARQVDPRFKMEKETAFLEALAGCQFEEALHILQSSGVTVSPDCVRTSNPSSIDPNRKPGENSDYSRWCNLGGFAFGEDPCTYTYPALTVAMIAGTPRGSDHPTAGDSRILEDARRHVAREPQVIKVVKVLIKMKANVNATGEEDHDGGSWPRCAPQGKTPLCAAVQRGSPTLVRLLLEAGADPNHAVTMGSKTLVPADFLNEVVLDAVNKRVKSDPRARYKGKILELLKGKTQPQENEEKGDEDNDDEEKNVEAASSQTKGSKKGKTQSRGKGKVYNETPASTSRAQGYPGSSRISSNGESKRCNETSASTSRAQGYPGSPRISSNGKGKGCNETSASTSRAQGSPGSPRISSNAKGKGCNETSASTSRTQGYPGSSRNSSTGGKGIQSARPIWR